MENIPRFSYAVVSGRLHFLSRLQLTGEDTEWDYNMSRDKEGSCSPVVNEQIARELNSTVLYLKTIQESNYSLKWNKELASEASEWQFKGMVWGIGLLPSFGSLACMYLCVCNLLVYILCCKLFKFLLFVCIKPMIPPGKSVWRMFLIAICPGSHDSESWDHRVSWVGSDSRINSWLHMGQPKS